METKKYIKIKTEKILSVDLESAYFVNFLYIFFLTMSLAYGALIFGIGEMIRHEKTISEKPNTNLVLENNIRNMAKGHPLENMAPYISQKDKKVASFLVAIAKKESNWGTYSPKKDGKECYNYWGYRGSYNQTASGYSCFDSASQAVNVVGGRIEDLVDNKIDTPKKMAVVWKCGNDCSWDNPQAVRKWVSDVGWYFTKMLD